MKNIFLNDNNPPLNPLRWRGRFFNKFVTSFREVLPLGVGEDRGGRLFGFGIGFILLIGISCSQSPEILETEFTANVTVADSIDHTGDYSGFQFLIFNRININDPIDTLFIGSTDSTGFLEGTIEFERSGAYPVQLSRNGRNLASLRFILADDDTITFNAEFPDLDQTLEIDSRENRAVEVFDRVDASFNRVNMFIQAGQVSTEEIPVEYKKFADLFWDVYEDKKGTFASKFAFEKAITLLEAVDQEEMMRKINTSFDEDYAFAMAVTLGKQFVAESEGFDATIAYLDSVKSLTKEEDIQRTFDQASIKLHLDSLYVEEARDLLTTFERKYEDDENYSFWYKNLRFELYELTPGEAVPEFEFTTSEGDTVNNTSLIGQPYVLEFTLMANQLYQQQYDESTVIYQLYAPQGLQYYTIPFDESANTIIGFFQERDRFWSIAEPPSVDRQKITDDFNIQFYPTRILVDAEGKMVRKYIGEEFEGIIPGIIETLKN